MKIHELKAKLGSSAKICGNQESCEVVLNEVTFTVVFRGDFAVVTSDNHSTVFDDVIVDKSEHTTMLMLTNKGIMSGSVISYEVAK